MTAVTTRTGPSATVVQPDLAGAWQDGGLAEIGEISVHLAALERTVLPAAAARIDDGQAQVQDLRSRGRELAKALHWLERHLSGDARLARWPTRELSDAVRLAAADHARSERAVVDSLVPVLDDREIAGLSKSYQQAVLVAPTRPHPWLSFRGFAGRIVFKLAARIDAIRDGLDNRSSDDIRARAAEPAGRLEMPAVEHPSHGLRSPAAIADGGPGAVEQRRSQAARTP